MEGGEEGGLARPLVLITNPNAGRAHQQLPLLYDALRREGLQVVETLHLDGLDRLRSWIAVPLDKRPLIVAAGGDGTVGTVAGAIAGTGTVLGIIPIGTSNDSARSLRIPMIVEEAVRLLRTGKITSIDAGQLVAADYPPRIFVHAAAIGLNVAFARLATRASLRRKIGRLTYLVAACAALRSMQAFPCRLLIHGRSIAMPLLHLSVINAPVFGGYLRLQLSGSELDDRRLDVLAIEPVPLRNLLLAVLLVLLHKPPYVGGVHLYHVQRLGVEVAYPMEVSLDGELAGCVPGEFVLVPNALSVITPQSFPDRDDRVKQ